MIKGKAESKGERGNETASMFCVSDSECVCDPACVVVSMAPGSFCSLLCVGHSRAHGSSVSDLSSSAQTHTRIQFISV